MLAELAFIGKDAITVMVVLTAIAAISLQITRRTAGAWPGALTISAFRAHLPVIDISLPDLSLPKWLAFRAARPITAVQAKPDCSPLAQRLPIEVQWAKLTGVIASHISRMEQTGALQQRAASQIDAAGYALERMLAELSEVMAITRPAVEPSLRLVETAPARTPRDAEPLAA